MRRIDVALMMEIRVVRFWSSSMAGRFSLVGAGCLVWGWWVCRSSCKWQRVKRVASAWCDPGIEEIENIEKHE